MFCTACGQKLPDGAKFCTKCGAPVAKIEPRVAPDAAPARDAGAQEAALSQETEPVQKVAPAQEAVPAQAAPDASQQAADEAKKAAQPEAAGEETPAAVPADAPVEAMETRVMPGAADATTVMAPDAAEVTSAPAEDDEPAVAPSDTDATTVVASDTGETRVMPEGSDETTVMPGNAETTVLPAADAAVTAEAERAEAAADAAAAEQALWSAPDAAADAGTGATTVLQPGHMADAPVGEVSAQDAQPPRKKRPVALIATIVLIVVAAAAFFAIFVLPRMMGKDVPTASYGQSDPLQCSVVTRVRPRDASGEDLTSYVVRLMRRASDDASKNSTASDAFNEVVAEIRVTGNNGFTMDNFGDIPDGDYMLVIAPDGSGSGSKGSGSNGGSKGNGSGSGSSDASDEQRIPIHYEEDNPKAEEEVVVEPPAPETDSTQEPAEEDGLTDEQIAAALYYYTCQDLIDEYGAPATADRNSGGEVAASGLALADLIDFDGDGTDELLTVVCTKDPATTTSFYGDDTYQVAVWRYADGAVEQVYEGDASHSNGGYYYVNLYEREADAADDPAQTVIEVYSYPAPTEPETEVTRSEYYGLGDDGFEAVASCQIESSYVDHDTTTTVTIDGSEASEDDWKDFVSSLEQVANYEFNLPASNVEAQSESDADPATKIDTVLPDALGERTQDTIDALEAAAGSEALEAYAPDEDDADDADDASEASYAYENVEEAVTFTTSQGDGMDWEENQTWVYPRITLEDGSTNDVLDALNEQFRRSFEDDLAATQAWTFDSGDVQTFLHSDRVTYLDGKYVCIRSARSLFAGGAHPDTTGWAAFYDLSTGEEVSIEEALGVPWSDLQAEAVDAISAYIDANPDTYGANEDSIEGMAADATRYYATKDGIVIIVQPYEIAPYSEGTQCIYVHAFNDPALVGTSASDAS
ncbi:MULTISPECIES: zinc-ribbon domain-containing protein [Enorma]|uniref:zinc-ribbon domain-containing protein n=1 Tax=Enorma TaxID=1472762 RepID=UPI00034CE5A9|nr:MULTISPECIES: zinc-ribbon domain-containing protein [Enorma]